MFVWPDKIDVWQNDVPKQSLLQWGNPSNRFREKMRFGFTANNGHLMKVTNPLARFVISKTSFRLKHGPDNNFDLTAYLDAEQYPYFVMKIPNKYGMNKGDLAYIENKDKNLLTFAIVGDAGDKNCEEGSLKLLRDLGYKNTETPYTYGLKAAFRFILFPKSSRKSSDGGFTGMYSGIRPVDIKNKGEQLFRRIISNNKANQNLYKTTVAYKLGFR